MDSEEKRFFITYEFEKLLKSTLFLNVKLYRSLL